MTISNFYTTLFSTKRLKSDQSEYETNLAGQYCHLQPESGEPIEWDDGAFYLVYNMWCNTGLDIQIGDQAIIDSEVYQVKEIRDYNIGGQAHMEIILGLAI